MSKIGNKLLNLSPTQKIAFSLISKDVVGCVLYTSQARSNKKFTPEQRADVANYDFSNGVINTAIQIAAVKPVEKAMTKFTEKNIMKHMFKDLDTRLNDKNNKDIIKLLKNKKKLTDGIVAVFSVIICQYFIKRVISPFFSVPAGEKCKQLGIIKPKVYEGEVYTPRNKATDKCDEKKDSKNDLQN